MAIAFRCAGNTQSNATQDTAFVVTKPSSPSAVVDGDLILCAITIRSTVITIDQQPPAGWVQVGSPVDSTSGSIRTYLYRKIASSEGASWTWRPSALVEWNAEVWVCSGADALSPIDSGAFLGSGVTSPITTTAVTTTTADQWVVGFVGCKDNTTHTWTDSRTERDDAVGGDGSTYFLSCSVADSNGPAGIGAQTTAFTHSTGSPQGVNAIGVVINPDGVGLPLATPLYRSDISVGQVVTPATSFVIGKPAGTIDGDLMIASVGIISSVQTITPPAGWTDCGAGLVLSPTGNVRQQMWYKIAASEPSNWTWTITGAVSAIGVATSYSGVNKANPIGGFGSRSYGSAQFNFPLVFSGSDLAFPRISHFVCIDSDTVFHTMTDTLTERDDGCDGPSSGNYMTVSTADSNVAVGRYNGASLATCGFTSSANPTNGGCQLGVLINGFGPDTGQLVNIQALNRASRW